MRYLTNNEDGSSKFWEARVDGRQLVVRYGKIGTAGQSKSKEMKSAADADAELAKLAREKLAKGYVEASPPGGGETGGGKTEAVAPAFPFLFFGRRPGDWASGANMGHAYELRFCDPPKPKARIAIAKAFEQALKDTPVQTGDNTNPWLWAGHWALFYVGERAPRDEDAFFDAIEKAVRAIHAVAPLGEVVFGGVRERGTSAWDQWSLQRQKGPSRNPHFTDHVRHPDADYEDILGAAPEEPAEDGEVDDAFEAAREKARAGAPRPAAGKVAAGAGKPTIVSIEAKDFPAEPTIAPSIAQHFPEVLPPAVVTTAAGWTVALGTKPETMNEEAYLLFFETPDATPKQIALPPAFYIALTVSPKGDRAFVVDRGQGEMYEITIPEGAIERVHSDPSAPITASYLDADHIAILTEASLTVLERSRFGIDVSARKPLEDMAGMVTAHGRIVLTGRDDKVRVLKPEDGSFEEKAKLPAKARVLVAHEGRVFLTNHRFPNKRTAFFEVQGLG